MYVLPEVQRATAEVWQQLRSFLQAKGWPGEMDEAPEFDIPWHDAARESQLLFTHACGYPFVTELRQRGYRYLLTPSYDFAGCEGAEHHSVLIVHRESGIGFISEARGKVAAINGWDSNTGMNLLRYAVAAFAKNGKFFEHIMVTGAHVNSMKAVANGEAAIAAVDAVTYGYMQRYQPDACSELRVIGFTAPSPALPLLAGPAISENLADDLRNLLLSFADSHAPLLLETLNITGFHDIGEDAYQRVLLYAHEAERMGYPLLA
jgi:ABC-type phosphate/phosphonate transport system substrate-binding protein